MSTNNTNTETEVSVYNQLSDATTAIDLRLEDVTGLSQLKTRLRWTFYPAILAGEPIVLSPIVLLRGPSGSGKRRFGLAIAGELQAEGFDPIHLDQDTLVSLRPHSHAVDEQLIEDLLSDLRANAPSVLVLDRIEVAHLAESTFTSTFEEIRRHGDRVACVIIASETNSIGKRHPLDDVSFPDFTLSVPNPDHERRAKLLERTVERVTEETAFVVDTEVDYEQLAGETAGFTRDALERVARRAGQFALKRNGPESTIRHEYLEFAIAYVADEMRPAENSLGDSPTSSRSDSVDELAPERPDVDFTEIGGLDATIERVQEILTFPKEFADIYDEASLDSGHGLLFHGPPGTGKTLLAKAIAAESDRTFFAVKGPELKNMYFGETERRLRSLFETASKTSPSLVFFDEFDALAGSRDTYHHSVMESVVNTLLTEMDGLDERQDILVVAATNRPHALDEAVLRPGRLDEQIEIPPPDEDGRADVFAIHSDGIPTASDVTPSWFASKTSAGITGADIEQICERALHSAMRAVQQNNRAEVHVTRPDILGALTTVSEGDEDPATGREFI